MMAIGVLQVVSLVEKLRCGNNTKSFLPSRKTLFLKKYCRVAVQNAEWQCVARDA